MEATDGDRQLTVPAAAFRERFVAVHPLAHRVFVTCLPQDPSSVFCENLPPSSPERSGVSALDGDVAARGKKLRDG